LTIDKKIRFGATTFTVSVTLLLFPVESIAAKVKTCCPSLISRSLKLLPLPRLPSHLEVQSREAPESWPS